jgi:hypothetical protein
MGYPWGEVHCYWKVGHHVKIQDDHHLFCQNNNASEWLQIWYALPPSFFLPNMAIWIQYHTISYVGHATVIVLTINHISTRWPLGLGWKTLFVPRCFHHFQISHRCKEILSDVHGDGPQESNQWSSSFLWLRISRNNFHKSMQSF